MTKTYTVSVPDLEWHGNKAACARDAARYEISINPPGIYSLYALDFIKDGFKHHCGNYCSVDNCKKAANEDHVKYCLRGLKIYE